MYLFCEQCEKYEISDTSVNPRGAKTGYAAVLELQGKYFLNVMFWKDQHYLVVYQAHSFTWQTGLSLTKALCLTGQQRDWSSERDCRLGGENSRAAQREQASDITKPFLADPWPPGALDRRGAQRRPILHSPPTSDQKTLTLSLTKAGRQTQTWLLRGFMWSSFRKLIFFLVL